VDRGSWSELELELELKGKGKRTICEGTTSNWVCLTQCRGAIKTCGADGELGDGIHDES